VSPAGRDLVELARTQLGKPYVFGVSVDLTAPDPPAFDCAEFLSWIAWQKLGRLVGCVDNAAPVERAEPYSGGWAHDIESGVLLPTSIDSALATAGVVLVRAPARGKIGHGALSDGTGGTVEAHSTRYGVSAHRISGRAWSHAGLLRGVDYRSAVASPLPLYHAPAAILRVGSKGPAVVALKRRLKELGYWTRPLHQITAPVYGMLTAEAVARFQGDRGLVRDGEAGPVTFAALGLTGAP